MTHRSAAMAMTVIILFGLLMTGGCAGVAFTPPAPVPVAAEASRAPHGWWYVRFVRDFPKQATEEPQWYMDLLIANEIVAPVLEHHRSDITLWRFHRRAVHDANGHSLSFILYASPASAEAVYTEIRSAPLLKALLAAGRVSRVAYDATDKITRPGVGDVSDKSWPPSIQVAWPHFIMGASQTWIELVGQKADELAPNRALFALQDYERLYRKVNEAVDELWRDDGRHAFLHHLNALFGYQPLVIYERKLLTF